ncbi:uronate dehydrogenase [Jatrophihabitans endophyticus]|uniref:Uronate dehydrogenase n=1 Tax=Jatrophihabitans endophyticus TaxID=1206085 RepID=A0A1M5G7H9_9ACTN|nr:NAD(P)-dependent oxidoreductase [Jatrophihabitans endophyticus]SHF99780.1 uronate dehydrogenase [Jatrophihabitans endophyticus]
MTVLLTGAAGRIGTALRERLPSFGWEVRGFDREAVPGGVAGDIGSAGDLDGALADGDVTAIVHLAGVPTEAPWPQLRAANVDGLYEVFEAARRHRVPRLVFASSNHAAGFTPNTPGPAADTAPRPDTLYGVTKAFGEALGRYYHDRYAMRVACLRIGTFAPAPHDARALATWLSPDDGARLVDACLRSPDLGFAIVWGVSANARNTWDHAAGRALGYEPRDDAERFAARLTDVEPRPTDALVGGEFTSAGYGIDEIGSDR